MGDEPAVGGSVAGDFCRPGMFSGGVDFYMQLINASDIQPADIGGLT
jgi:hypothetical protein